MIRNNRDAAMTWYFFRHFKMELYQQGSTSRDQKLVDDTGKKSMPSMDVFSAAIRFLRVQAIQTVKKQNISLREEEIKWVLTVPAIWDDGAKQFMREAAEQAGIEKSQLILALEPEAASVHCLHHYRMTGKAEAEIGRRFMTVDCGGGTVDISAFEFSTDGRLAQLCPPVGADCGGVMVDKAFKELLAGIVTLQDFIKIDGQEMLEVMMSFEVSKRVIGTGCRVIVRLPASMRESVSVRLLKSKYKGEITMINDRLSIPEDIALELFSESREGVVEALGAVLKDVGPVDAILLVGGLSESKVIQDAVREAFPEERVLVPPSPSLTVVKGAVQYGHCPQVISTRVAAFTYGFERWPKFVEGKHDEEKAAFIEGEKLCMNVFDTFIHIHEEVRVGKQLPPIVFRAGYSGQTLAILKIYRSKNPSPAYVTEEGCEEVGRMIVEMPDLTGGLEREIHATVCVSDTELRVTARDGNTKKKFDTTLDFLSSKNG